MPDRDRQTDGHRDRQMNGIAINMAKIAFINEFSVMNYLCQILSADFMDKQQNIELLSGFVFILYFLYMALLRLLEAPAWWALSLWAHAFLQMAKHMNV